MLLSPWLIVWLYAILTLDWVLFFLRTRRPLYLARAGARFSFTIIYLYISLYNPPAEEVRYAVRWAVAILGFDLLMDFIFVRMMDGFAGIINRFRGMKHA